MARSPTDILSAAIHASGLSSAAFARDILSVSDRAVRYWLAGERRIPGPVLRYCTVLADEPEVLAVVLAASGHEPP